MNQFRYTIVVLSLLLICTVMYGTDYDVQLSMDGPQAGVPASVGTGSELGSGYSGCYYNATTNQLFLAFQFSGLTGNTTAAHIHGPADLGVQGAPVLVGFVGFPNNVKSGSHIHTYSLTDPIEVHLFTGKLYVNIHSTTNGGGEIRGQLIVGAALPVELVSFNALVRGRNVELAWKTATETNNHGFEVERKTVSGFRFQDSDESSILNHEPSWSKIGFVEGNGTINTPKEYSFTDANASGTVLYRLKQIDRDGKFEYHDAIEVVISQMPLKHSLMQNYPNPFNPTTMIGFTLSPKNGRGEGVRVTLKVYDVIGNEVASLVNGVVEAGMHHQRTFDASTLAAGVYFYTLRAEGFSDTKKLVLVK